MVFLLLMLISALFTINPILVAIIPVIALSYYLYLKYRNKYFERIQLPSPPISSVFLGNLKELQKGQKGHLQLLKWEQELGKTYGIYEGAHRVIVSSDLELLNDVFVKQFDNFHSRKMGPQFAMDQRRTEANLFVSEGGRWKRLRAIIATIFVTGKIRKMEPVVTDSVKQLMAHLHGLIAEHGNVVDIKPPVGELTMDVMQRLALGKTGSSIGNGEEDVYVKMLLKIFDPHPVSESRCESFFAATYDFLPVTKYLFTLYLLYSGAMPFMKMQKRIQKVVDERRSQAKSDDQEQQRDFIDLLLEAEADDDQVKRIGESDVADHIGGLHVQKKLNPTEIPGLGQMFLIAGFDTSASAMTCFAYRLASNPEVQQRLFDEIESNIFGDEDITYDVLQKMPYLDWCTREALRIDPLVASVIARRCVRTTTVAKGLRIDAGVSVMPNVWSIHFDKEQWGEDADLYRPERWDPTIASKRHPLAWIPFGIGPRLCVGNRFALHQLKMTMIYLLREFRLTVTDETEFNPIGMVAVSPQQMKLRLVKRKCQ